MNYTTIRKMYQENMNNLTKSFRDNEKIVYFAAFHISLFLGIPFAFLGGQFYGHNTSKQEGIRFMQKEAIVQHYAQYGETDGQWRWKTPQEAALAICEHYPKAAYSTVNLSPTVRLQEFQAYDSFNLPALSSSIEDEPSLFPQTPIKRKK